MRRRIWALGLALVGCAQGPGIPQEPNPTPRAAASFVASDRFDAIPGRLDAIAADRERDVAPCLVRLRGVAVDLVADLAPAISPMPPVTDDAIEAARRSDVVQLVSRWGVDGELGPYVATFTYHPPPPDGSAIVVFVESDTSFVRSTIATGPREDRLPDARLAARLGIDGARPFVVVTAGPAIPIARIVQVMRSLDASTDTVAFGVAFVPDEPLPETVRRTDDVVRDATCPPPRPVDAVGSLSRDSIRDAVRSLDGPLRACVSLGDPRIVGRGGRLRLATRIDPEGRATDPCALEDSLGDPRVRTCILDAIRAHVFPTPSPSGSVDVSFPLVIPRSRSGAHAAICR